MRPWSPHLSQSLIGCPIGSSSRQFVGLSVCRFVGLLARRFISLSVFWFVGLLGPSSSHLSYFLIGIPVCSLFCWFIANDIGMSVRRFVGLLIEKDLFTDASIVPASLAVPYWLSRFNGFVGLWVR